MIAKTHNNFSHAIQRSSSQIRDTMQKRSTAFALNRTSCSCAPRRKTRDEDMHERKCTRASEHEPIIAGNSLKQDFQASNASSERARGPPTHTPKQNKKTNNN